MDPYLVAVDTPDLAEWRQPAAQPHRSLYLATTPLWLNNPAMSIDDNAGRCTYGGGLAGGSTLRELFIKEARREMVFVVLQKLGTFNRTTFHRVWASGVKMAACGWVER